MSALAASGIDEDCAALGHVIHELCRKLYGFGGIAVVTSAAEERRTCADHLRVVAGFGIPCAAGRQEAQVPFLRDIVVMSALAGTRGTAVAALERVSAQRASQALRNAEIFRRHEITCTSFAWRAYLSQNAPFVQVERVIILSEDVKFTSF